MHKLPAVLLLCLILPTVTHGREKFAPAQEPPAPATNYKQPAGPAPAPARAADEAVPEPEITITTKGEDRHAEYRIAGRLYMVKVTPKRGAPYYLVDQEGQGQFVRSDLLPATSPPLWVIKRF